MKIKPNCVEELASIGIKQKDARKIQDQPCEPTGRKGSDWTQVEFDGALLGLKEPFVFCVPNSTLEL